MDLSCKKTQVVILIAGAGAVAFLMWQHIPPNETPTAPDAKTGYATTSVTIGTTTLTALIADTPQKRRVGLSGRNTLAQDTGMLFVFPDSDIRSFWMKDMLFPIDIIWIDTQKEVVHITRGATPDSYPQTFPSLTPVQYVLETNAGTVKKVRAGDSVHISKW